MSEKEREDEARLASEKFELTLLARAGQARQKACGFAEATLEVEETGMSERARERERERETHLSFVVRKQFERLACGVRHAPFCLIARQERRKEMNEMILFNLILFSN